LYIFEEKGELDPLQMWTLKGTYVKSERKEIFKTKEIYPFSIYFSKDAFLTFTAITRADKDLWVQKIKEVIGYASLTDYYEIKVLKFSIQLTYLNRKELEKDLMAALN
jgi:hypothetical protein